MKHLIFLITLVPLFLIAPLHAQDDPIRVKSNLVTVSVNVTDKDNKFVSGLTRGQFEVFDDGVKQTIEHFSAEGSPRSFGVVYDMHPTTGERSKLVIESLRRFASSLGSTDTFFSVLFNERGSLVSEIVPDLDQLERHLARPDRRELSSLYDAIYLAADKLRLQRNVKKVLIVISDAEDHGSRHSYNAIRDQLRRLNVQVYSVIPNPSDELLWTYNDESRNTARRTPNTADRAALNQLAHRSGGAAYATSLSNQVRLDNIIREINEDTQKQYSLGFYPTREPDNASHNLEVRLKNYDRSLKGLSLSYRQSYSILR